MMQTAYSNRRLLNAEARGVSLALLFGTIFGCSQRLTTKG